MKHVITQIKRKHPLIYYDDPILRQHAKPISAVDSKLKDLISEMIEIMDEKKGVGLAGNQVGELLRVFVIRPEIHSEKEIVLGPPEIFINPILSTPSKEKELANEGCLSLPGLHIEIARPISITIEAMNLEGIIVSEEVKGFKARQIMHENDHLNGVLFIDRTSLSIRKEIGANLRTIKEMHYRRI